MLGHRPGQHLKLEGAIGDQAGPRQPRCYRPDPPKAGRRQPRRTSASRCVFGPRSVHSEDMTTDRGPRAHPVARPDRSGRLPLLLDIEGVAEVLGVSVRHVRRLVAERRIPYIKWGRYLRFDPAQLEVWIEDARIAAVWLVRGCTPPCFLGFELSDGTNQGGRAGCGNRAYGSAPVG
jgi:excisionase family DNA binding protein